MTQGQIEALEHHASAEIKALYLPIDTGPVRFRPQLPCGLTRGGPTLLSGRNQERFSRPIGRAIAFRARSDQ